MNAQDIDKLEAGRELDALVLKAVFGIEPQECMVGGHPPGCPGNAPSPPYSTDIAAAWLVLNKLRELDKVNDFLDWLPSNICAFWYCVPSGELAPAICRAALKAVAAEHDNSDALSSTTVPANSLNVGAVIPITPK